MIISTLHLIYDTHYTLKKCQRSPPPPLGNISKQNLRNFCLNRDYVIKRKNILGTIAKFSDSTEMKLHNH